ncbi:MAG: hypothetical protein LUH82_05565 [Clostridiales bacterium]|nr:hypothetical protein [Clostridiales bacterium]
MKNQRITYLIYQVLLILCQIGIIYGLDYQAVECSGYGFYYNAFAIQLFFTAEFIIATLVVAFRAEYFFENVGIVITLRYKSKQKIYVLIIIRILLELILYKIIATAAYAIATIVLFGELNVENLLFSLLFNILLTSIICIFQVFIEIKLNAKMALVIINSYFIVSTTGGAIIFQKYFDTGNIIYNIANRFILPNYYYLQRIIDMGLSQRIPIIILLLVLSILVILTLTTKTIKKTDIL